MHYLDRTCPACGETNARHDQDFLDDGECSFTGTRLDEIETVTQPELPYDPQDLLRKQRALEFYRDDLDGGTPARHNVRINSHFASWLADENSAGRFPNVDEAGRQYDEKYT